MVPRLLALFVLGVPWMLAPGATAGCSAHDWEAAVPTGAVRVERVACAHSYGSSAYASSRWTASVRSDAGASGSAEVSKSTSDSPQQESEYRVFRVAAAAAGQRVDAVVLAHAAHGECGSCSIPYCYGKAAVAVVVWPVAGMTLGNLDVPCSPLLAAWDARGTPVPPVPPS